MHRLQDITVEAHFAISLKDNPGIDGGNGPDTITGGSTDTSDTSECMTSGGRGRWGEGEKGRRRLRALG